MYPDTAAQEAAISAEDWFAGRDADPVMMSLREVFQAAQMGKEPSKGGSVLRQASRRMAGTGSSDLNSNKPVGGQRDSTLSNGGGGGNDHQTTPSTQSASMSRLTALKPPSSSNAAGSASSHEPSPNPIAAASSSSSSSNHQTPSSQATNPTTYTVN